MLREAWSEGWEKGLMLFNFYLIFLNCFVNTSIFNLQGLCKKIQKKRRIEKRKTKI